MQFDFITLKMAGVLVMPRLAISPQVFSRITKNCSWYQAMTLLFSPIGLCITCSEANKHLNDNAAGYMIELTIRCVNCYLHKPEIRNRLRTQKHMIFCELSMVRPSICIMDVHICEIHFVQSAMKVRLSSSRRACTVISATASCKTFNSKLPIYSVAPGPLQSAWWPPSLLPKTTEIHA